MTDTDHGNDVTLSENLRKKPKINVIVKNKSTTIFHNLIDYRNEAIKCSKLCSETTCRPAARARGFYVL